MKPLGVWLATVGGAGYVPGAPGTVGAAVGVAIMYLLRHSSVTTQAIAVVCVSAVGIWASNAAISHFRKDDPGTVVIDEVAGQMLSCLGVGLLSGWGFLVAFALFRAFDILKPWPVRKCEALHGGLGIMADDLMAGIYASILLAIGVAVAPQVLLAS